MIKRLSLICASFILSSCLYHSGYHQPVMIEKNDWTVKDHNLVVSKKRNLPYIAWWKGFRDPALNELINCALVNNNTLAMSKGHIQAAQGELKKIYLQWFPNIDFLLGYSKNPATAFPGFLVLFLPSYTLNIFTQVQEQKKANYELAAVNAEDDAIKLTIISQITAGYFTYLAEIERRTLLRTLAEDSAHLAKIAYKVYKGGLGTDIDPETLTSEVNKILGEEEIVEHNIVLSRNALRYLINKNPGSIKTKQQFLNLDNKQLIPGSLPLTVLENRPDLQIAAMRLRAANEGIGIAGSKLLPSMHLDLFMGPTSGNNRLILPRQMIYFNDELLTVPGLRLSVLGEISKAKGLDKASYFNYVDTLQKALRDATNALSANERLSNKLKQTELSAQHVSKAYVLNKHLYQRGIQNYIDLLKSKIALDKVRIDLNRDKLRQLLSIVNLYQELAGGYKAFPSRA